VTLRIVAHVHSDWSYDGRWALGDLARAFRRRGCDVVLMSEHDRGFDEGRWQDYRRACAECSGPALLVPGIEYSDSANRVHVIVWGRDLPFLGEGLPTSELLAHVREVDGLAFLAHPGRHDVWRDFDPAWAEAFAGVEVWNRKYDGWAPSARAIELAEKHGLTRLVGLDFHTARQFFPLRHSIPAARGGADGSHPAAEVVRGSPTIARLPVRWFLRGGGFAAARTAERGRKRLARAVRALEHRLGR
jgi:predicted metal-dependent phosphoesterase TrpH